MGRPPQDELIKAVGVAANRFRDELFVRPRHAERGRASLLRQLRRAAAARSRVPSIISCRSVSVWRRVTYLACTKGVSWTFQSNALESRAAIRPNSRATNPEHDAPRDKESAADAAGRRCNANDEPNRNGPAAHRVAACTHRQAQRPAAPPASACPRRDRRKLLAPLSAQPAEWRAPGDVCLCARGAPHGSVDAGPGRIRAGRERVRAADADFCQRRRPPDAGLVRALERAHGPAPAARQQRRPRRPRRRRLRRIAVLHLYY